MISCRDVLSQQCIRSANCGDRIADGLVRAWERVSKHQSSKAVNMNYELPNHNNRVLNETLVIAFSINKFMQMLMNASRAKYQKIRNDAESMIFIYNLVLMTLNSIRIFCI